MDYLKIYGKNEVVCANFYNVVNTDFLLLVCLWKINSNYVWIKNKFN